MSVESFQPAAMQFSATAANKVKSLIEEEGNERLPLQRLAVCGGGAHNGFLLERLAAHLPQPDERTLINKITSLSISAFTSVQIFTISFGFTV